MPNSLPYQTTLPPPQGSCLATESHEIMKLIIDEKTFDYITPIIGANICWNVLTTIRHWACYYFTLSTLKWLLPCVYCLIVFPQLPSFTNIGRHFEYVYVHLSSFNILDLGHLKCANICNANMRLLHWKNSRFDFRFIRGEWCVFFEEKKSARKHIHQIDWFYVKLLADFKADFCVCLIWNFLDGNNFKAVTPNLNGTV